MKPHIPWLRVFVEGVVIVGSILLAFGIDAWWEERQERAEEQELLVSLLEEFRANERPLDQRIDQHRRFAHATEGVVEIVSSAQEGVVSVPDSLLAGFLGVPTYNSTLGSLEEAQSSGRVRLIQNSELRTLLAAWPGRLADALESQESAEFLWYNRLHEVLGQNILINDLLTERAAFRLLAGQPSELGSAARDVPVTPGLENYARHRAVILTRSANELSGLREVLGSIITLLELEIR